MTTFNCTLNQFKQLVAEFHKAADTANLEELDAGFKCVSLHYFGITPQPESNSAEEIIATSAFNFASNKHIKRSIELQTGC